jgi:hypothetical protein
MEECYMAYDLELDTKIKAITEPYRMNCKKMFGGTCYLEKDKMVCGVWKDYLILRLGEEQAAAALKLKNFVVFDITGKPMKGWAMVKHKYVDIPDIKKWVEKARQYVGTIKK